MEVALGIHKEETTNIIAYADDLSVMVAVSRKNIAQSRAALILDRLIDWAEERGLTFSSSKMVAILPKGGIKPG